MKTDSVQELYALLNDACFFLNVMFLNGSLLVRLKVPNMHRLLDEALVSSVSLVKQPLVVSQSHACSLLAASVDYSEWLVIRCTSTEVPSSSVTLSWRQTSLQPASPKGGSFTKLQFSVAVHVTAPRVTSAAAVSISMC